MKYIATIEYTLSQLKAYKIMLDYGEKELTENNIPRLSNIQTWTAEFDDGMSVDIKLNSSEDDIWTEAVLFDGNGSQVAFTDVCDNLDGVWSVEVGNNTYEVELKGVN